MVKLLGACLVIFSTSAWGMLAAKEFRNQYCQMQHLQRIFYRLRSEILYSRAFLAEAFRNIAPYQEEPYSEWLFEMSCQMEKRQGIRLSEIWKIQTKRYLSNSGLPDAGMEKLIHLGEQMGSADIDMQVRILDLYLEEMEHMMEEMQMEQKTKIKLYHCMGVLSGLFISILLI